MLNAGKLGSEPKALMPARRRRRRRLKSNSEVLLSAGQSNRYVRVRISFQVQDVDAKQYVALSGKSIVLSVRSPKLALEMVDETKNLLLNWRPKAS